MTPRERNEPSRHEPGSRHIGSKEDLIEVLASGVTDLRGEWVTFSVNGWANADGTERANSAAVLADAISVVCSKGLLPQPDEALPGIGTPVEAMLVGGKPGPSSKYGTGVVDGVSWDLVFSLWRVHVVFAEPPGYFYGQPINRTQTFPWMIHVIGGGGRPFSSMTPSEIVDAYQQRAREFRRTSSRSLDRSRRAG